MKDFNTNNNFKKSETENHTLASNSEIFPNSTTMPNEKVEPQTSQNLIMDINQQLDTNLHNDIEVLTDINSDIETLNNTNSDNQQNSILVDSVFDQNVNNPSQIQLNQNIQSDNSLEQNSNNIVDNKELLKDFIGNNYEKITTRKFNFAGFFLTSLYLFYRKMFGYGLLTFLLIFVINIIINNFIVNIVIMVALGLLANKLYLSYANKKITKIKLQNPNKNINELKKICSSKGGTSFGKAFLGIITELGISLVIIVLLVFVGFSSAFDKLFDFSNWKNKTDDKITNPNNSPSATKNIIENVNIKGYSCSDSNCDVIISDTNDNNTNYKLGIDNHELFLLLDDYEDYIKLNIFYTQNGTINTIVDYKIYLKSNNQDISSIKSEDELRDKIGLFSIGTHTDLFMFIKKGTPGFGVNENNESYTYATYIFKDNNNTEYSMEYKNENNTLDLIEGNKYSVTFEVTKDTFDYNFTIISVE